MVETMTAGDIALVLTKMDEVIKVIDYYSEEECPDLINQLYSDLRDYSNDIQKTTVAKEYIEI